MEHAMDYFGSMVFNDEVMQARLPKSVYRKLKSTIEDGNALDRSVASVVANAMKDWALEKGATHFTHWFQPMTGITAEKHDSFISPIDHSKVIMEFSGKELIKGEPDASSFPNGGMRSTFEARGYTAWDPTSYAFIKDKVLYIPTVFCSYSGASLDKKTPLLKSVEVLNKQALRVLKYFGNNATRIHTTVGAEQEYFLIDKALYEKRKDLILTGRTLFGAAPAKGQEMEDHYFGNINRRVQAFMNDLNKELWKLGIYAKTEHKEVAPGQYELAPIFTNTNLATDQNQLTMEFMQRVADDHGFACLLHEKPFAGINGSGKHNNWSMSTNTGENLLDPGDSPSKNAQFLVFLTAIIKAVDEYQDLLRISVASASNDHRLGANEAPPAIVSIFVGEDLEEVLEAIESGKTLPGKEKHYLKVGTDALPALRKDNTDRNRTSPFAFTGNKFEFRMLGSSFSIACTNMILNTIVAEALQSFADAMEGTINFQEDMNHWILTTLKEHRRIIFNGNGYDESWVQEAEKRGLLNFRTTPEAVVHYDDEKNIKLFAKHGIFTPQEMVSRKDILLENYCKTISVEGMTMARMVKKDILPAAVSYMSELAETICRKQNAGCALGSAMERSLLTHISEVTDRAYEELGRLEKVLRNVPQGDHAKAAAYYCETVLPCMNALRVSVDDLEGSVARKYWNLPTYEDMLNLN